MTGWIKIYRDIRKHWIFDDDAYFRAWCIILMTVNYEPKKMLIGKQIIECGRGQSLLSLSSWVKEFGVKKWSVQRVRTFFQLLQDDDMISVEGLSKTTRLTVLNYDSYQDIQHTSNTQLTNKQHSSNTQLTTTKEYKEVKEIKETKNKKGKQSASQNAPQNDFLDKVVDQFCESHGSYEVINRGKERLAAGRLIGLYKKKYPGADSQSTLEGLRVYFDKCNAIHDNWMKENMSLSLILSKYNEINKILLNGKSTSKKQSGGVSDQFRRWVFEGVLPNETVNQMS